MLDGAVVVVTGADGFIGSHLATALAEAGASVRAMCIYNSNGSCGWLDELEDGARKPLDLQLGDVRDEGFVRHLVDGADVVFHLAALIAIPYSYVAPASFVDTNVRGTLNVLEACRAASVSKVVLTSTSEVYGTPTSVPITEEHALNAQSPYAATKVAADQLGLAYASSYGLNTLVLRPFNTYGPRQSLRAVIPTVLSQLLAGLPTVQVGSLHPRRDFTYVSDTVQGFLHAAEAPTSPGDVVQLGTGTDVTIGDLISLCIEVTGANAEIIVDDDRVRPEASEVQHLLSDRTRAGHLLGWEPTVELREGLQRTAEWLRGRTDPTRSSHYHR